MTETRCFENEGRRDRGRGALVGLACGDAVGTTAEFKRPGSFEPITDMVGGGPFGLDPGQWTDDTSMALCLAESIIDVGDLDLADQLRRYVLWRDQGHLSSTGMLFDIGTTTSNQLARFERTGVAIDPHPDPASAANGSLMRLAPVPMAWHHDVVQASAKSAESSRSTHAASRPVDACRLLGAMLAALIDGEPPDEVFDAGFWRWDPLDPDVAAILRGSFRAKEPPDIRGTGYCIDALEAALWAVIKAGDFRDAVLRAANLGDDADTTAAIAGQLAGARWGASSIPEDWRAKLTMHDRIVSLADSLIDREAPDTRVVRWPYDHLLHAWWVRPGRVLAGEYPWSPDRDRIKLNVLLDAGIRTFVDLTSAADHLDPYREDLIALADMRGLAVRHVHRPIADLGTLDRSGYREILDLIGEEANAGRPVYVHCWGGVGRTGTVIGCLLADVEPDPQRVLAQLVELRAGTSKAGRPCPETNQQLAVIRSWAATR